MKNILNFQTKKSYIFTLFGKLLTKNDAPQHIFNEDPTFYVCPIAKIYCKKTNGNSYVYDDDFNKQAKCIIR